MTTAQEEEIVHHPLEVTAAWLSEVTGDPLTAQRAPLAGVSRLRELLGSLRDGERRQQHGRDDQSFQHG